MEEKRKNSFLNWFYWVLFVLLGALLYYGSCGNHPFSLLHASNILRFIFCGTIIACVLYLLVPTHKIIALITYVILCWTLIAFDIIYMPGWFSTFYIKAEIVVAVASPLFGFLVAYLLNRLTKNAENVSPEIKINRVLIYVITFYNVGIISPYDICGLYRAYHVNRNIFLWAYISRDNDRLPIAL